MDRAVNYIAKGNVLTAIPFPFVVCFPEVYIQILVKSEMKAVSGFLSYSSTFWCERSPFGCTHVARLIGWNTIVDVVVAGVLTTFVPLVLALAFP
jgi:hypothetical protein